MIKATNYNEEWVIRSIILDILGFDKISLSFIPRNLNVFFVHSTCAKSDCLLMVILNGLLQLLDHKPEPVPSPSQAGSG